MLVQSNNSYPFSNPFASSSYSSQQSSKETSLPGEVDHLKNDFSLISQDLNLSERKLFNTLLNDQNYQAAKGIVTIGFMRASGVYHDSNGESLSGESLSSDLNKLYPPNSQQDQNALLSLQNYLRTNPSSLALDKEKRGNLLDLKI